MNSVPDQPTGGHDQDHGLVDVSDTPLLDVIHSADTVLAHSMRRLVAERSGQDAPYAGFGNYTGGDDNQGDNQGDMGWPRAQ